MQPNKSSQTKQTNYGENNKNQTVQQSKAVNNKHYSENLTNSNK